MPSKELLATVFTRHPEWNEGSFLSIVQKDSSLRSE
jgi:hypothetical protein